MKKMVVLLSCMAFGMFLRANAQTTPIVDQRQTYQRERIQAGVAHGDLTRRETANAVRDQRQIRRTERSAKADGEVTRRERAALHHTKQEGLSSGLFCYNFIYLFPIR